MNVNFNEPTHVIAVSNALQTIRNNEVDIRKFKNFEFDTRQLKVKNIDFDGVDFDGIFCGEFSSIIEFMNGIIYCENSGCQNPDRVFWTIRFNEEVLSGAYNRNN